MMAKHCEEKREEKVKSLLQEREEVMQEEREGRLDIQKPRVVIE